MTGTPTYQGQIGNTFAGASVMFDLVTHAGHQYLAYYDENREIQVKHRTVGATDGPWDSHHIANSSYDTGGGSYKSNWDIHNWLRLGVDASGNLHLSGDMHGNTMRYWRTTTPGDISTLTRYQPFGTAAPFDQITYPEFIRKPDGDLGWFLFRTGKSGNGELRVSKWNNNTQTWGTALLVMDSTSSGSANYSPYWEVFYTTDQWYHIIFSWREGPGDTTNTKMSYVKTQDWINFVDVMNRTVSVPMTWDSTRPPIDAITGGDPNFVNNEYQFNTTGVYTIVTYKKTAPDGSAQMFAAVSTSGSWWSIHQITNIPGGVGLVGNMFPENYIVVTPDGGDNIAVDTNWSHATSGFTQRTAFHPANVASGPFASTALPETYWPSSIYQTPDSFSGVENHVKSDSRSSVQTIGSRHYICSAPVTGTAYVITWLGGPEGWPSSTWPYPAPPGGFPLRPIYMWKITNP